MESSVQKEWKEQMLKSRYLDPRALIEYLDSQYKEKYRLTSQRGIFIISTQDGLSEEELARIENAAKPKQTPASKRLAVPFKTAQKARSRSPKDRRSTKGAPSSKWKVLHKLGILQTATRAFQNPRPKTESDDNRLGTAA